MDAPMISSEVQRTLVKSPPELWAELSDPGALARHLGDLGEIRITRVEPEEKVEWEAPGTTGTVLIKASGWGTRVTLTVQREMTAPPPATVDSEEEPALPDPAAVAVDQPEADDAEPASPQPEAEQPLALEAEPLSADLGLPPEPTAASEPPAVLEPAPEPAPARRGFIARFLYFFRGPETPAEPPAAAVEEQPTDEPAADLAAEDVSTAAPAEVSGEGPQAPVADEPAPEAAAAASPPQEELSSPQAGVADDRQDPVESVDRAATDLGEELRAAEESTTEQVTAVLTAALDRLGSAHHRPFSRA
jgi:hypothetical protein